MATTKALKIDGEKLKDLLISKGFQPAKLSRELGYSDGYISESARTGKMGIAGIKAIEHYTGIKYEDFKVKETIASDSGVKYYSVAFIRQKIQSECGTLQDLGDKIGRSDSTLSRWLNGSRELTIGELLGIAYTLNLDEKRIPKRFEFKEVEIEDESENENDLQEAINGALEKLADGEITNTLADILKALNTIIDNQNKERKYLAGVFNNTKQYETYEQTVAKTKAPSQIMTVAK